MMEGRDVVLEGVLPIDIEQLQRLATGRSLTADPGQLARIRAKGWMDTVGDTHLITLTGRAVIERQ